MKSLIILLCLALLAGCSSSNSSGSGSGSGGGPGGGSGSGGSTELGYVPLSETLFMGDAILENAPWVTATGNYVGGGTTIESAAALGFGTECSPVPQCNPSQLQIEAPGKKRVLILLGSYDALAACNAIPATTEFGDASVDLNYVVRGIQGLFNLQVVLGTIPNIYNGQGQPICASQVAAMNQLIKSAATANGAEIVNLNSALDSSADFITTGPANGLYLPNATGYSAMESAYAAANQ